MDRIPLKAEERVILGKKVKRLRKQGLVPGHVYGNKIETEHVSVEAKEFLKVFNIAGETGLIDLKIGAEKIRPVMIRGVDYDPVRNDLYNIDFYQVNLSQKVSVPVPIVIVGGEEIELVKMGEAVVLQTINEVQVEALPADLVENIEVSVGTLKIIDDAITVGELNYDRSKLNILAEEEEVVVKLAPAVTEEMKKLMEEQAAEAAAAAQAAAEEGVAEGEVPAEGEEAEGAEGKEAGVGGEAPAEGGEASAEQKVEGQEEEKKE